jgi:hypothetical protein
MVAEPPARPPWTSLWKGKLKAHVRPGSPPSSQRRDPARRSLRGSPRRRHGDAARAGGPRHRPVAGALRVRLSLTVDPRFTLTDAHAEPGPVPIAGPDAVAGPSARTHHLAIARAIARAIGGTEPVVGPTAVAVASSLPVAVAGADT